MIKFAEKMNMKFNNQAGLLEIANVAAKFYGLDIHVDEADFNPDQDRADLKVVTPSGKVVAIFHLSIYRGEKHWSIRGQTFITSDHTSELSEIIAERRAK